MSRHISFHMKSKIENIYTVERQILDQAGQLGYDADARFSLRLAMDEALINAIKHGNRNREDKHVWVTADCDEQKISVSVRDEGNGFSLQNLHDPRQEPYLNVPNGRGVFLIHQFTHDVRFNDKGNEITFTVHRQQPISVPQAS